MVSKKPKAKPRKAAKNLGPRDRKYDELIMRMAEVNDKVTATLDMLREEVERRRAELAAQTPSQPPEDDGQPRVDRK
jgi:hypothetical protein